MSVFTYVPPSIARYCGEHIDEDGIPEVFEELISVWLIYVNNYGIVWKI